VIGDFIIRKKQPDPSAYERMILKMPACNVLTQTNKYISAETFDKSYVIKNNYDNGSSRKVSKEVFDMLNGKPHIGQRMEELGYDSTVKRNVMAELIDLWTKRFVMLSCE